MAFPYKNPISPIQVLGPQSVNRDVVFGTHFSTNGTGGYMEVFSISGLTYEIPSGQTGSIEYSGNTIPINFIKGNGAAYSPNVLILNSDNISSGRRKLGMLVYVYEFDQVYQYDIPNYEQLWTAATASTNCVVINEFGTTVRNNTIQGQAFINAWTASTIEGINGVVRANARWKKYWGNNLSLTGGSYNGITNTLTLVNITGGTVNITGFGGGGGGGGDGITGGTFNLFNGVLTLSSSAGTITVSGFLYGSGTTNTLPKYVTSSGFTDSQITDDGTNVTIGGNLTTISADLLVNQGVTATTISATTYFNLPISTVTGSTGISATTSNGTVTITNTAPDQTVTITGGTNIQIVGTYPNFGVNFTGSTTGGSVSGAYLPLSGGTVTGNTIFTSGLTVNYIDFDTTPNVPSPTGGTLYFDSTENALSYKPITPSNDVTVNLGQESLIRIYNDLGFQINNGQALHITGSTSGSPTVSLAVGTGGDAVQFQISGIATHDIPDSTFGFITVFGTVRDINLTGFTVGEQIYLSQTVPGGLASYSDLSITGRTCEVGHVLDNSALGKLQVSILNEIEGSIITTQENNILAANNSSTGVFNFSGLSISTPSGTTFNVGPVEGWIIDNVTEPQNPTIQLIIYPGSTGNTALYVSSATETYILLTSGLTLTQQTTFPTPQERRQNLYLGKFGHANKQYLINAFNEPDSSLSPVSQLRDMFTPIRLINGGIYPSANGNSLTFNTSGGVLYGLGIGYITNKLDPNSLSVSGTSPCTFQYRTQTGGTASNTTLITPGVYDNNGVITAVGGGSNSSTNQRIYLIQNGQFRLQYGQQVYGNLAAAIEASQSEAFTTFSNFRDNAILIGILSVNKNATNLSDTTQARFLLMSKFGETVGAAGGISTTNLQQAYNNSSTPEIVTNSAEGALSIQNGTGADDSITNLFEGRNTATSLTSFIRADGAISGTSIFGSGSGLTGVFQAVRITGTTQFSANTNNYINFSGINMTITSGSNNTLVFSAGTTGGGGLTYYISGLTPGGTINNGDRWFDTNSGLELVYINDGDSSQWIQPNSSPGSFTGNTSANCISQLYVTNVYGCSPINFNDPVNLKEGATFSGTTTFNGPVNLNSGFTSNSITVTAATVNGNLSVTGTTSSTSFSGNSDTISGTKGSVISNGSTTTAFITVSGSNTIGGTDYNDFIRAANTAAGATNPTKTIRVNITGGIEFLNNAYTAQILTLTDGGVLSVGGGNTAVTSNNDPSANYLSFNNNFTTIYDDGNTHIHSRSNGGSMWINTNNGAIILGNQSPVLGGGAASAIIMGSGSTTTRAYANIYGSKTYTIGSYGYLATIGAGTGAGTTAPYSLYCDNRIEATEFDATSDERLKDIQGEIPLNDAITLVNNLKPIKYTWKNSEDKGIKTGYSAQQVEKAGFRHLIGHIPNEDLKTTTDSDGFTSPEGFQLTMNYDQVTPYHGVVIKHLLDEIKSLKEEIKELKYKIG